MMKKTILLTSLLLLSIGVTRAQESQLITHKADSKNSSFNWTMIKQSGVDSNPNIAMLITHNSNPKGSAALIHNHKAGLFYVNGAWRVFNENAQPMDTGLNFNVFIPGLDVKSWVHTADSVTNMYNYTQIDHALINKDSSAIIFVTDVWNYGGKPGVYNTNPIGVFYNNSTKKWCIFHEEFGVKMIKGSSYSVVIPEKSSDIVRFVHRSDKNNVVSNTTLIDHPDANNNPAARIIITQNWNPNKGPGRYNKNNVGVFYNGSKWAIFNESLTKMDTALSFNVMIYSEPTNSTNKNKMNSQVHIFPNPVQNGHDLEIGINNSFIGNVELKVMDLQGRVLLSKTLKKSNFEWQNKLFIENLSKGVYLLNISNPGFNSTQQFVIE